MVTSRGVAGHGSVTGATGRAVVRGDFRGAAHGCHKADATTGVWVRCADVGGGHSKSMSAAGR